MRMRPPVKKRTEQNHEKVILEVENYSVAFDRQIMEEVTFSMEAGEKVAIVRAKRNRKDNHFA